MLPKRNSQLIRSAAILAGVVVMAVIVFIAVFRPGGDEDTADGDGTSGNKKDAKSEQQTSLQQFAATIQEYSPKRLLEPAMVGKPVLQPNGDTTRITITVSTKPNVKTWRSLRDRLRKQLNDLSPRKTDPKYVAFETKDIGNSSGNRGITPSALTRVGQALQSDKEAVYWVVLLQNQKREPETQPYESNWTAYSVDEKTHQILQQRNRSTFAILAKVVDESGELLAEKSVPLIAFRSMPWLSLGVPSGPKLKTHWLSPAFWRERFYRVRLGPLPISLDADTDAIEKGYRIQLEIEEFTPPPDSPDS